MFYKNSKHFYNNQQPEQNNRTNWLVGASGIVLITSHPSHRVSSLKFVFLLSWAANFLNTPRTSNVKPVLKHNMGSTGNAMHIAQQVVVDNREKEQTAALATRWLQSPTSHTQLNSFETRKEIQPNNYTTNNTNTIRED